MNDLETHTGLSTKPTPDQLRAASPGHSAWVTANAGSGKTRVLVDRVVRLLLEGVQPASILCLTFTKAAAAEMSSRLYARLSGWINLDDTTLTVELAAIGEANAGVEKLAVARRLFALALETPGGLKIQTIHAFAERLLQLFPVESGLAPGFRVMDERQERMLTDQVFRDALMSDDEATWAFLSEGAIPSFDALKSLARPFFSGSSGMRQFLSNPEGLSGLETVLRHELGLGEDETVHTCRAELLDIDEDSYNAAALTFLQYGTHRGINTSQLLHNIAAATTGDQRQASIVELFIAASTRDLRKELVSAKARNEQPDHALWLVHEQARILEALQRLEHARILENTMTIYRALARVMARLNIEKRDRGLYDFDDLIARAAHLLTGREAARWVLYKLDPGLDHVLVDEAQDTSPSQWAIIRALTDEFFSGTEDGRRRTVFAVGDRKQSIYSFQGADPEAYRETEGHFVRAAGAVGNTFENVKLTVSFRSLPVVLKVVDKVFEQQLPMSGLAGENAPEHQAVRKGNPGIFELWPLVESGESAEERPWDAPVDLPSPEAPRLILARNIALAVKGWIGRRKLAGEDRTVRPEDILILLQSRGVLFTALIAELRRLGVPVAGADRLDLQESLIIADLVALGQVMRLPEDDHLVACLLKSPLVPEPITEEELIRLAASRKESLWQAVQDDARHGANARQLGAWQELSTQYGPHDFYAHVVQRPIRAIHQRLGSEATDAIRSFIDLALAYEAEFQPSLSGFLEWFAEGESPLKREMEQASGEVRIMTVHGSKGLEAPIVILPDASDMPWGQKGKRIVTLRIGKSGASFEALALPLFLPRSDIKLAFETRLKEESEDRDLKERMRLLYVAMTRARDELYVCGSKGSKELGENCWYTQIRAAITDPALGAVSIPDPSISRGVRLRIGSADQLLDSAEVLVPVVTEGLPQWLKPTAEKPTTTQPMRPMSGSGKRSENSVALKRGIAIHRLFETLAELPEGERHDAARRRAEKMKLSSADAGQVLRLLSDPALAVFFAPGGQAEVEIRGYLPNIGPVSGRVDRLRLEGNICHLLDFKSGRRPEDPLRAGQTEVQQLAQYAAVIRDAMPGTEVRAALLWTQDGLLDWLDGALLSQALDLATSGNIVSKS